MHGRGIEKWSLTLAKLAANEIVAEHQYSSWPPSLNPRANIEAAQRIALTRVPEDAQQGDLDLHLKMIREYFADIASSTQGDVESFRMSPGLVHVKCGPEIDDGRLTPISANVHDPTENFADENESVDDSQKIGENIDDLQRTPTRPESEQAYSELRLIDCDFSLGRLVRKNCVPSRICDCVANKCLFSFLFVSAGGSSQQSLTSRLCFK